jgi:hypothetical protein
MVALLPPPPVLQPATIIEAPSATTMPSRAMLLLKTILMAGPFLFADN